jgi:predicted  nucleic acid-binding Zn-ribbon protein
MDTTYRSDLRELNGLNFARFDAKLEQRIAELRAEIQVRVAELRSEMQAGFARVDQRFAELETRLTKRLFAFWVAQAATTAGLVLGVIKLLGR